MADKDLKGLIYLLRKQTVVYRFNTITDKEKEAYNYGKAKKNKYK